MAFGDEYRTLRFPLKVGDEFDQPRIDFIEQQYPKMKDPAIGRAMIDDLMAKHKTPPPWAKELMETFQKAKFVRESGSSADDIIDEAIGKGFNFGDGDFFGDDNDNQ